MLLSEEGRGSDRLGQFRQAVERSGGGQGGGIVIGGERRDHRSVLTGLRGRRAARVAITPGCATIARDVAAAER